MSINVAQKALEVYDHLVKNGFGKFPILVHEKECTWHEQYAIFITKFLAPESFDHPYIYVDHDGWDLDFQEYLEKEFPGCAITHYLTTGEIEICGPKYKEFYKKYAEELEEIASASSEWSIFIPKGE